LSAHQTFIFSEYAINVCNQLPENVETVVHLEILTFCQTVKLVNFSGLLKYL